MLPSRLALVYVRVARELAAAKEEERRFGKMTSEEREDMRRAAEERRLEAEAEKAKRARRADYNPYEYVSRENRGGRPSHFSGSFGEKLGEDQNQARIREEKERQARARAAEQRAEEARQALLREEARAREEAERREEERKREEERGNVNGRTTQRPQ